MKKLGLIGAVLLVAAAPALARVDIKCAADGNIVTVSYRVVGEPNKVRAFALDLMVTSPAVIGDVNNYPVYPTTSLKKYWVYPGSIVIGGTPPDVTDAGTPVANPYDPCVPGGTQPGLDSNGVTIEMGSLYYPTADSSPNSPAGVKTGSSWDQPGAGAWEQLLKFRVDKRPATPVYVAITENTIRGGVVLTNPASPEVNAPGYNGKPKFALDCLIGGNAGATEYANWVKYGRPKCWCYPRHCRGDIDGKVQGAFWVSQNDMVIFRTAVGKLDNQLPVNGICADIDHKVQGAFRVSVNDIVILRKYIGQLVGNVPTCDKADVPRGYPAPYTGPYNWWTAP